MTPPVDPNQVLMTGENSFIRLSPDGGKTQSDRISHWRVLWCPDGAGHALFIQSTLLGDAVKVYSDNEAVARWLQRTIVTLPPGFNNRPIGVFSTFFPARSARVELNGRAATGQPWPEMRGNRQGSSACLAW